MANEVLKSKIYEIIFEADTKSGKLFDILLLVLILLSILNVSLESVSSLQAKYASFFYITEWVITIFFTIEYVLRVYSVNQAKKYVFSVMGIIDLLATLPMYVSLVFVGTQSFMVFRALRLLRIFRILKLSHFVFEEKHLRKALKKSAARITVFLISVSVLVLMFGALMYLVEGEENGFSSIPQSVYWSVVTISTVGYGDIVPLTVIGKMIASFMMLIGYSIIAIPTGIVTAEIVFKNKGKLTTQVCPSCLKDGHDNDAIHCKFCSAKLNEE